MFAQDKKRHIEKRPLPVLTPHRLAPSPWAAVRPWNSSASRRSRSCSRHGSPDTESPTRAPATAKRILWDRRRCFGEKAKSEHIHHPLVVRATGGSFHSERPKRFLRWPCRTASSRPFIITSNTLVSPQTLRMRMPFGAATRRPPHWRLRNPVGGRTLQRLIPCSTGATTTSGFGRFVRLGLQDDFLHGGGQHLRNGELLEVFELKASAGSTARAAEVLQRASR